MAENTTKTNKADMFINESIKEDRRKRLHSSWTFDTDDDGNEVITIRNSDGYQIHQEKFSKSDIHALIEERARKNMRKEENTKRAAERKKLYNEFCRSYGETMLITTVSSIIAGLVVKVIKRIKK